MPANQPRDEFEDCLPLALAHYRNQDWKGADIFIRQYLSGYPDKAEGWFVLGMIAKQMNNQKLAEDCLARAFKLKKNPVPIGFPNE